ncbi:MAG: undecaprenyl diphosphate synthase family protein [Proteobacteria bacterium]|nr:undecaprenyl diphosphate synthase family protein [Pseudomonadota bacterium]
MRRGLRWAAAPVWRLAYGLYERQLERQVRALPMPGHVGIILDGNRRHPREDGVQDPDAIYRLGAAKLADMPDPDLIIRASGEVRLSGFMLCQSVHSELYFCDVNWPVMRRIDYLRAIRAYQRRERRFGT